METPESWGRGHGISLADRSTWILDEYRTRSVSISGVLSTDTSEAELISVLAAQPEAPNVWTVSVHSGLSTLSVVDAFASLRRVLVQANDVVDLSALRRVERLETLLLSQDRRKKGVCDVIAELPLTELQMRMRLNDDPAFLARCPNLESALLQNWRFEHAEHLNSKTLRSLRLGRGKMKDFAAIGCPSLTTVDAEGLTELESVQGLNVEALRLTSCHKVREETYALVPRLRRLHLSRYHALASFSFIARCPVLQELSVVATQVTDNAIREFPEHPTLLHANLFGMKIEALIELSRRRPSVRFTNGERAVEEGRVCSIERGDSTNILQANQTILGAGGARLKRS